MNNWEDVYNSKKEWYDGHLCRKYLITQFLPQCVGRTLSVGTHDFNINDYLCVKDKHKYETIDLDEKYKIYGSPYKHTTIDFIDYEPGYNYDNIILFGVLGCPLIDNVNDKYTLDNHKIVLEKVDKLLNLNGKCLFGLDLQHGKNSDYWDNLFNEFIKNNRYKIVENLNYHNKIVVINKINN